MRDRGQSGHKTIIDDIICMLKGHNKRIRALERKRHIAVRILDRADLEANTPSGVDGELALAISPDDSPDGSLWAYMGENTDLDVGVHGLGWYQVGADPNIWVGDDCCLYWRCPTGEMMSFTGTPQ